MPSPSSLDRSVVSRQRRDDLQGLRAVAVLAVIAYHFGIPGVPGGFVGVDIFFVLSGFFITRLLIRDIEQNGRIRLGNFWANRVKRLLPNGLIVILSVLVASTLLLPSYRLPGISGDALSAAAFFANFHFAAQTVDYFHLDDPPSPLLHFWSLAVEEQFYVALPLLMTAGVVLSRIRARAATLALLGIIAATSLTVSLIVIEQNQPVAFFHTQYRAWQLALGGMLAMVFDQRESVPQAVRSGAALIGALAITASIALLNDHVSYPGLWALAPTFGTAALIFGLDAGRYSVGLTRAMTVRPMVRIGDMSYSLYLWHWPVAVFMTAMWPGAGGLAIMSGLVVTALLGSAAYELVERPIHRMPLPALGLPRVLAAGAGSVVLTVGLAVGASALTGRSDAEVTALIAGAANDRGPNYENGCHLGFDDIEQPDCRFGRVGGPRVVLFGDSHAAQWFTAVVKAGEEAGWEVNAWTKTSCPSVDVTIWYAPSRSVYDACNTWRKDRMSALIENPPQLVMLANSAHYYGWIYDETRKRGAGRMPAETLWLEGVKNIVEKLIAAGVPVVQLHNTPQMYASYRDCLSRGAWNACARPRSEALAGLPRPELESPLTMRLDLSSALCSAHHCSAVIDQAIAYRDSHHLTASHAATLYQYFYDLLSETQIKGFAPASKRATDPDWSSPR